MTATSQQEQPPAAPPAKVGVRAAFVEATLPVKVVLVGVLINRLGGFLNLFLVLYLTYKGYSTEQAAAALSAYGAGAVAGVLMGGTLANRLGPRTATVISMTGTFLIMGAWLYLPSYPVLVIAAVLVAMISQLYRPASATLLSDLTPDDRQVMTFALYRFGLNLGATAAPLLGLGLYYLAGHRYNLVFWGEALIALGYAVLAWTALPAKAKIPPKQPHQADSRSDPGRWSSGYLRMLRDWRYSLYLLAIGMHAAVYVQYLSTLPLNIKLAGLGVKWYTLAVALNGLIVIAFELGVTKVTQILANEAVHRAHRRPARRGYRAIRAAIRPDGHLDRHPGLVTRGDHRRPRHVRLSGHGGAAQPERALHRQLPVHVRAGYGGRPAIGGFLLVRLGHGVWPVLALGSLLATVLVLIAVRQPRPASTS